MLVWEDDSSNASSTPVGSVPLSSGAARNTTASPTISDLAFTATAPRATTSTAPLAASTATRRVNAADKRIINGQTDVNQLVPFKYKCCLLYTSDAADE